MKSLLCIVMCVIAWPVHAEDPWMYPVAFEPPITREEIESVTMRLLTSSEIRGESNAVNTSRTVHESVASFDDIVNWYSDRLKISELSKKLSAFNAQVGGDPEFSVEGGTWTEDEPTETLISFWFTANQKQVTFMLSEEGGSTVAVSLLGLKGKTRILVMRRRTEEIACPVSPLAESNPDATDAGIMLDAPHGNLKRTSRYPLQWGLDVLQPVQSHRPD